MIGGIVTETIRLADRIWVNCVSSEEKSNDHCAIYVERNSQSERIKPADSFWWQGCYALWTPYENKGKSGNRPGRDCDIRIPRIGSSGVSKPLSK
jgi:hypothetical protein